MPDLPFRQVPGASHPHPGALPTDNVSQDDSVSDPRLRNMMRMLHGGSCPQPKHAKNKISSSESEVIVCEAEKVLRKEEKDQEAEVENEVKVRQIKLTKSQPLSQDRLQKIIHLVQNSQTEPTAAQNQTLDGPPVLPPLIRRFQRRLQ
ncbi:MAG: hypothetical protein Q9198_001920 [Flavoplaca austrocitrina]